MANPYNANQGQKSRVRIIASDPQHRVVHGQFKDGGSASIAVFEIPAAFRWPLVDEVWTVHRQNLQWILGERINIDSQEQFPVTDLTDDELRLDGITIFDASGKEVITISQSGVQDGNSIEWDEDIQSWIPATTSGIGAPDATATVKGILKLTNDLSGTANAPAVDHFTLTSDSSAGSHKITNLATPTTGTDAATKAYVDAGAPPTGAAGGDLTGSSYPNPIIANGVVTVAKTASSLTLDSIAGAHATSADVNINSNKLINVTDPTSAQDVATKNYVDTTAIASINNNDWKASVRVVATTNGTLASAYANGQVVDGITLATNDRILLTAQTTTSENGIYTVNAAGAPTRAVDAATSTQLTIGATVEVEAGTIGSRTKWTYILGAFTAQVWSTDIFLSGGAIIGVPVVANNASIDYITTGTATQRFNFGGGGITTIGNAGIAAGNRNPAFALDLDALTTTAGGIGFGNGEFQLWRSASNQLTVGNGGNTAIFNIDPVTGTNFSELLFTSRVSGTATNGNIRLDTGGNFVVQPASAGSLTLFTTNIFHTSPAGVSPTFAIDAGSSGVSTIATLQLTGRTGASAAVSATLAASAAGALTVTTTSGQQVNFVNSPRLTAISDPSNPQDAATKHYVDNTIAGSVGVFIGQVSQSALRTAPALWKMCDGSAISRTTYSSLFAAIVPNLGTVTITNATPAVVSLTSHGFNVGDTLYFTTTGTLPTGISPNTLYYVSVVVNANSFQISTSRGGGSLATSSAGSGTHTCFACPYGLGDGSTTFNTPDYRGRVPMGAGTGNAGVVGGSAPAGTTNHTLGQPAGEETHTMTTGEMVAHSHGGSTGTGTTGTGNTGGMSANDPHTHTSNLGGAALAANISAGNGGTTGGGINSTSIAHTHSIPGLSVPALSIGSQGLTQPFNVLSPYTGINFVIYAGV